MHVIKLVLVLTCNKVVATKLLTIDQKVHDLAVLCINFLNNEMDILSIQFALHVIFCH